MGTNDSALKSSKELADELLLKRFDHVLGAPDEWRRRAATASGLLSTAAAALLAGLLIAPRQPMPESLRISVIIAALAYLIAVGSFLHAATRSTISTTYNAAAKKVEKTKSGPSPSALPTQDVVSGNFDEIVMQIAPIKRWVLVGKVSALVAITLTVVTAISLVTATTRGHVRLSSTSTNAELLLRSCPKYTPRHLVEIEAFSPNLNFIVPASLCEGMKVRVSVPANEAIVALRT